MAKIYGVRYQIPQRTLGICEVVSAVFQSVVSRNLFKDFLISCDILNYEFFQQEVFDDAGEAIFDYERRVKHPRGWKP